jgi:CRISPR-associated exonuclease Cas4
MNEIPTFCFRVIDLKQYVYCPRILYYHTVLPGVRPLTYKMEAGIAAHVQEEGKEKRRSLRSYGLSTGRRSFNVPLFSAELGLSGELDMLIETDTERIPVDYKQSKKVGQHFKLQLMAYGRLLERAAAGDKAVNRGFLYLIPLRKAVEVRFTHPLRRQLSTSMIGLRHIAQQQQMPHPTKQRGRCVDCEFRRFCNDSC